MRWADKAGATFRSDEAARIIRANELYAQQQADHTAKEAGKQEIAAYVEKLAIAASLGSASAKNRLQQLCFDEIGEFAAKTAREALAEMGDKNG
ncbi:MAG: hypothetical protein KGJ73_02360 [Rhodospirillales bacterium]|nr:hypothetical protein [Rhodospirillales bacterium]